ncbi:MAG: asparagine synthase (glutamine-hydrolyzing) [Bacteroidetes bacterium]|nr:asparagine synthase (glutamine-hydrolyzing) [Bacteroidota bacterium]
MCGISGLTIISKSNIFQQKPLKYYLGQMNKKLAHRGPDDSGFWVNNSNQIGLAQTRLSIIDLSSAGHQPMIDPQTKNIITFNGEIFNYRDINAAYLQNEKFDSGSDTETILKLYQKFGLNMFDKMNGMFAFGLWDEKQNQLVLARDPSGKKPLYYTEFNGIFAFASELKALLALPWVKRDLDYNALYDFLTYDKVLAPATMFKNIYKFKPGHYMIVNREGIKEYKSHFELKKRKLPFNSEKDLQELIFSKLQESVKYRMISDVPVGAFLSGGVDSSAIVALMRENTPNEIKTFTIGFKNQPNYNELSHAQSVSQLFNTTHYEKIVTPNDLLGFIEKITEIYDEPQSDTTAIPIYFISKLAREKNIKVVLNGDGPDELFAGYNSSLRYAKLSPYYNAVKKMPQPLKLLARKLVGIYDSSSPYYEMADRLVKEKMLYWPGAGGIKESNKTELLTSSFLNKINGHNSYQYVEELHNQFFKYSGKNESEDIIDWMSYSGYRHADIERFLFRSDRLGMANSIESRSPFLNHEMVELALSIPSNYKIRNNTPKYILKKSLERILPNSVLYRKKMGFCLPIREWAGDTISAYVIDNAHSFASNTGLFSSEEMIRKATQLKNGKINNTNTVWTLYFLMNWFKKWL